MQHTYLRYECADAFSLTTSSSTTSTPTTSPLAFLSTSSNDSLLLSTSGSQIIGFNLRTNEPCLKIGHRELLSGGIGTGRGLNSNEVLCLAVTTSNDVDDDGGGGNSKIASGWKDGSIRIFDVQSSDLNGQRGQTNANPGLVHSFLSEHTSNEEEFLLREPLVLNGHSNSPVTCLSFDDNGTTNNGKKGGIVATANRLVSGSTDGTVVLWDVLAETGLFRLLGHVGPITDLSFITSSPLDAIANTTTTNEEGRPPIVDALVSSSHDGLVKVWDLDGQCCAQTIVNHGGQVTCSTSVSLPTAKRRAGGVIVRRERLVTGCSDGRIRLYSIEKSPRLVSSSSSSSTVIVGTPTTDVPMTGTTPIPPPPSSSPLTTNNNDDICHYMGELPLPTNVAASNEKISSLHFHRNGKFLGISRNNSKELDVYLVRTQSEAEKKRLRRLRRRREKERKETKNKLLLVNGDGDGGAVGGKTKGRKRGILDDDEDEEVNDPNSLASLLPPTSLIDPQNPEELKASDEFKYLTTIRCSHKIKAFTFAPTRDKNGGMRVVTATSTNAIEVHSIKRVLRPTTTATNDEEERREVEYTTARASSLDMYGHPTGIRSISLSSDDALACTVSKDVTKVWNVANRSCIRSLIMGGGGGGKASATTDEDGRKIPSSFYGLCSTFLPGNTHVVVGTREGYLIIVDIASGDVVFTERGHDGAIWSLDLKRASKEEETISIVTGSADKSVKFWDVERQEDDNDSDGEGIAGGDTTTGHPMLVHVRTLQTKDDVIAVRYSHSHTNRLIFVSTLDCQINVFFDDTLKFFLSLYGHSLPALAIDSSDDDTILASGGADKSIKIWGLDFGDTHRTMYGHGDSITDLKFVEKTHNFFTASKDSTVRYWDGDRFEQILLLDGHSAEVNCLAIGRAGGAYVLSAGMDRQVRVWERTKDMVFLEEEKERAMESIFEKVDDTKGDEEGTAQIMRRRQGEEDIDEDDMGENGGGGVGNANLPQSEAAVKKSVLSVAAGDRIMEAIERADQEMKEIASFKRSSQHEKNNNNTMKRMANPMLLGMEPPEYILWVLRSVKSSELEMSLLILPLTHMERLIYYMIVLLRNGKGVEICARASVFLIKTHHYQVAGSKSMAIPLRELRRLLKTRLVEARDTIGYNLASVRIITKAAKDHKSRYYIPDPTDEVKDVWAGLGLGSEMAANMQKRK